MPNDAQTTLITRVRERLAPLWARLPVVAPLPAPTAATTLAAAIDHTLLKPDATPQQIEQLCNEARDHGFFSVCVNPDYVQQAAVLLMGSPVVVCTVIGFPLGANTTAVKVYEAEQALSQGARELDMVLPLGRLRAGEFEAVYRDIAAVVATCHAADARCKVIVETAVLDDAQKVGACLLAQQAGADFVKTSTGFAGGGATVADVTLFRATVGAAVGVKASGGIRTPDAARALLAAGANRLGASASVQLVSDDSAAT